MTVLPITREDLYETLVLWPAYQDLYDQLCETDPRTGDPAAFTVVVAKYRPERCALHLAARGLALNLRDADHVLEQLLDLAAAGSRPRYGREIHPDLYQHLIDTEGATL